MSLEALLEQDFNTLSDLLHFHAGRQPDRAAAIHGDRRITYAQLDREMDRIAAALQRDGLDVGDVIAICATTSIEYLCAYLGALRAGVTVAPLAPSSTPQALAGMIADCGARLFFLDASVAAELDGQPIAPRRISLDGSSAGEPFEAWKAPVGAEPTPVTIDPGLPFNIIYSSGTTGAPKGIVQSHKMRWMHVRRRWYDADATTLISTPLYSNTTLVALFPTLAKGGTVVLMAKFDVVGFLELAQRHRATHAMLVPVQIKRIMAHPEFDSYDLSSFRMKTCTSAPFAADLKADVLRRWPGGLIELFGMTEGGGSCMLFCHEHPDKLHTVGRPTEGHDIRLVGDDGREVAPGEAGEVVGHSGAIMNGYHNQPAKTAEAEWFDDQGRRFMRMGDVGRFDEDGFLILMDRKKDMIISGGFNIYPSDLEAVLNENPAVAEAAVVGVASDRWGETPIAFVVLADGASASPEALMTAANSRLGKTQRLSDLQIVEALPRSPIGKVLKRELRDAYAPSR